MIRSVLSTLGACLALAFFSAHAAPPPDAPAAPSPRFVPMEAIVKLRDSAAALDRIAGQKQALPMGLTLVRSPAAAKADPVAATWALIEELRRRPDVEYAHPNYLFELSATPSDPLYAQQWHYPLIQAPQAWDLTLGAAGIRIAILDTGRTAHPDLAAEWGLQFDAADQDFNAQDDGYVSQGQQVFWRHGTHVAAIAGGSMNNGLGGASVCPGCTLLPVRVSNAQGLTTDAIIRGINWAVSNGARVMNMSFEMSLPCNHATVAPLRNAIAFAIANNVSVVAAAGNQTANAANTSPASCAQVIAVAATDRNNNLAPYSNFGAVTVAAPGGGGSAQNQQMYGIGVGCPADNQSFFLGGTEGALSAWTTSPGSGNAHCYRYLSGTSMASPHVAGVVGLMLSANPALVPAQVIQVLRDTAQPLPACGGNCGAGLVNAFAAVQRSSTGPCSFAPAGALCTIDSLSHYTDGFGGFVETVTAYGRTWNFDLNGNATGPSAELRSVPRYASGPCAFGPFGQPCRFDSVTTLMYPGAGYVESITAYGRYWNFNAAGAEWGGGGSLLSSVPRYAGGPCLYAFGGLCTFDTRNLIEYPGWGLIESITAYGRYFIFDAAGTMIGGDSLRNVARYAAGPCAYAPAGGNCSFDARELAVKPGAGLVETITAYGRYWEWDGSGNVLPGSGALLNTVPRFR